MTPKGELVVNGMKVDLGRFRNRPLLAKAPCPACNSRFRAGVRLGSLLEQLRDEQELTTADLAEAAGVDEDTMQQILDGEINCPPRERLEGLASLLDVTVSRLIDAAEEDGCDYGDDDEDGDDGEEDTEDSVTQRLYLDYQANLAEMNGVLVP